MLAPDQARPDETARDAARLLMKCRAVTINSREPFVYTSGIKSPIYTDNRLLISYPEERQQIVVMLTQRVADLAGEGGVQVIAGTATAGIPWAAWVASQLGVPLIYVRPNPKEHGKSRQIEGILEQGQRVAVVEDLITTGISSLQTVEAIRQAGGAVDCTVAIFTYEFEEARQAYAEHAVKASALTTISTLLDVALADGYVDRDDRQAVLDWLAPHRPTRTED